MEWKHPSIIVLKGYPFTGKTKLSVELAYHLRLCLLLSLDDILHAITPHSYSPTPTSDHLLINKGFDILCSQVEKQLSIDQSVIIDSLPLSKPLLVRLATLSPKSSKIIIVECQIERQYFWQMRFNKEHREDTIPWYKPRSWEEVADIVKGYDKSLDELVPGVSRLYLNVDEPVRGRHLIQAIQTLVFCKDDRHVDYQKWSRYNLSIMHQYKYNDHDHDHDHDHTNCGHEHDHDHGRAEKKLLSRRLVSHNARSCKDGCRIGVYTEQGLVGYNADCIVCDTPVIGPAYACNSCQATLHKSCAETNKSFTPQEFPAFIQDSSDKAFYSFPENFPCFHCKEAGEEFSQNCSGCVFESLLKCGLVPTIIEHEGHAHKLSLWAMKIEGKGAYTCAACGKEGEYAAYGCDGCEKNYHVKCALLPYPIKEHKHSGHEHNVELIFERKDKEDEDFPCSYCEDNMSPEDWYYYCALCEQTYHLECAFYDDA